MARWRVRRASAPPPPAACPGQDARIDRRRAAQRWLECRQAAFVSKRRQGSRAHRASELSTAHMARGQPWGASRIWRAARSITSTAAATRCGSRRSGEAACRQHGRRQALAWAGSMRGGACKVARRMLAAGTAQRRHACCAARGSASCQLAPPPPAEPPPPAHTRVRRRPCPAGCPATGAPAPRPAACGPAGWRPQPRPGRRGTPPAAAPPPHPACHPPPPHAPAPGGPAPPPTPGAGGAGCAQACLQAGS